MFLRRKKNNFNTLLLYFNLIIKWGKSQKKNFTYFLLVLCGNNIAQNNK